MSQYPYYNSQSDPYDEARYKQAIENVGNSRPNKMLLEAIGG
jgi:hypothetical protein